MQAATRQAMTSNDETVGLSRDGDIFEYKRLGDRSRAIYLKLNNHTRDVYLHTSDRVDGLDMALDPKHVDISNFQLRRTLCTLPWEYTILS